MVVHNAELQVVTGAFDYTGKYITRRLQAVGKRVRTLTGHPQRQNPFGDQVMAFPFNFDNPAALIASLEGATTLYNTYWIRFAHGEATFERAVENSRQLIAAAEAAGVRRIVHISIMNASPDSTLPYFRGKGLVEQAILHSNLSYTIIRPTVVFGAEDILINNIAWLLRRLPIFAIPGSGNYRVQPIFVEDLADLAVGAAQEQDNLVIDAVGPEIYTFEEMVRLLANHLRSKAKLVHLPPRLALALAGTIGTAVHDVVLTRDEVEGLISDLLVSGRPPTGRTRFSEWLERHADSLGNTYASELERHYR